MPVNQAFSNSCKHHVHSTLACWQDSCHHIIIRCFSFCWIDEMSPLHVSSYAELIAELPVVVLGVCTVLIVVCALVGILVPDLPDFSDPLQVSFCCFFFPSDFNPSCESEAAFFCLSFFPMIWVVPLIAAVFPPKRVSSHGEQLLVSDWSHGTTWWKTQATKPHWPTTPSNMQMSGPKSTFNSSLFD